MTIKEAGNWLIVRIEAQDRSPDLEWNRLITWKIPESDRIYVKDGDFWIVRRKHRRLLHRLFSIYEAMGRPDLDTEVLQQCDRMVKEIEGSAELKGNDPRLKQVRAIEAKRLAGKGQRWPGMYEIGRN